jgi:hypothetical protein
MEGDMVVTVVMGDMAVVTEVGTVRGPARLRGHLRVIYKGNLPHSLNFPSGKTGRLWGHLWQILINSRNYLNLRNVKQNAK